MAILTLSEAEGPAFQRYAIEQAVFRNSEEFPAHHISEKNQFE
jgi:hypothetical protein